MTISKNYEAWLKGGSNSGIGVWDEEGECGKDVNRIK